MKKFFYFILLTTCILIQAVASPIETTRKKVGLVLSGGGAKGMAHIGVLKVIEEAETMTESPAITLSKENVPVAIAVPSYTLSFADKDGMMVRTVMFAFPVAVDKTE